MPILQISLPQISSTSWRDIPLSHSSPFIHIMLLIILVIASIGITMTLGSDNNNNGQLPPTHPDSPHDWSSMMNPSWGPTWPTGNWGINPATSSNSSIGAQPGAPLPHMTPMWPAPFYGQQPNPGPPGVYYPLNWGGYMYPVPQTAYVQPNDDLDHQPNSINDGAQVDHMNPTDSKGKKKASDKELSQLTNEEEEIHGQDRIGELEDQLKEAHESLAAALQHNEQLKQALEQSNRGTKWPLSVPHGDSPAESSSKRSKQPPTGPSAERQSRPPNNVTRIDDELSGYLSDAPRHVITAAEGWSAAPKHTKNCKKDIGKVKQLTILP
ncbi:hypothetical protein IW262DRAFT_1455275 [Armillaria fumosa]|nr:hypothetical protein IW262DRAFT_1455275 [Armillaria fumosa]